MKSGFSFLGDLVRAGLERTGLKGAVRERTAAAIWPEIVGPRTAAATRIDRVRDGVMYVNCRDSMWAQELHFLRPIIINKINEKLGIDVIREIRLSGTGFRKRSSREEEEASLKKTEKEPELDERELDRIAKAASVIEDPELAKKVMRGLKASRLLRKKKE